MRILIACEMSGRVRDAMIARGHDAVSCDILPSMTQGPHIQGDVLQVIQDPWDMVIGFPPCTDLAASNAHLLKVKAQDGRTAAAIAFFLTIYGANAPRVAVENPVGVIPRHFRKADQIVNPYQFGDPYLKKTCLWLRGLPNLIPTHNLHSYPEPPAYFHHGSGYNVKTRTRALGRAYRAAERSMTFPGIANAMAEQWA
jgi:hypothetical protein